MTKEEVMEKYTELQLIDQQINQMQQQIALLENKLIQLKNLNDNLEDIHTTKANTEILAPLGAGIYFKSSLKDTKSVLINIGANVVIKKDILEAKKIIQNQLTEIEQIVTTLTEEMTHFILRSQELRKDLQSHLEK